MKKTAPNKAKKAKTDVKSDKINVTRSDLAIIPYFCTCCSEKVANIDQAFVLDEKSSKYFCSEACIVAFHQPYIQFFQNQEDHWRAEFKCESEKILLSTKEQQYWLDLNLKQPDEVWLLEDAVGSEYFCMIKRCGVSVDSTYVIVITHLFNLKPSFVFHHTFTKNLKFLEKFRWGKSFGKGDLSDMKRSPKEESSEDVVLSKDLMQEIELLRSQLLSELILMRTDHDIPLEGFSAYEKYMEKTIDKPDETFEFKTKDGHMLLVNISDQQEKSKTIYYFVVSMKLTPDLMAKHAHLMNSNGVADRPMIIPVLAFPSVDSDIYQFYKRGHCINKRSLN